MGPDGHRDDSTIRYALAVGMVVVPVVMAVVYGLVREVPQSTSCGDVNTDKGLIDSYRSGVWWLGLLAEAVALAALALALRGQRGRHGWAELVAMGAAAGAIGIGIGSWYLQSDLTESAGSAFALGLLVIAVAGGAMCFVGGVTREREAFVAIALAPFALLVTGWVLLLIAIFLTFTFAAVLAFATLGVWAWLGSRLGREDTEAWRALVFAAAFFAVLVIPGEVAVIVSRGHGPFSC